MKKITSAQKPFKMLVANLRQGSDPSLGSSGNPVKVRSSFTTQHFVEIPGRGFEQQTKGGKTPGTSTRVGKLTYSTGVTPVAPTFTITVSSAASAITELPTVIILGEYKIVSDVDFAVVAGNVNTTASNLATYIATLNGWAAVPDGANVNVEIPSGIDYNQMLLKVTGPFSGNYTISPVQGYPVKGEPYIGPPEIG